MLQKVGGNKNAANGQLDDAFRHHCVSARTELPRRRRDLSASFNHWLQWFTNISSVTNVAIAKYHPQSTIIIFQW